MINDLRPLTQEQRQTARQAARHAVVRAMGPRPAHEHFAHHSISKYPPTVTRFISVLSIVLLLAALLDEPLRPGGMVRLDGKLCIACGGSQAIDEIDAYQWQCPTYHPASEPEGEQEPKESHQFFGFSM